MKFRLHWPAFLISMTLGLMYIYVAEAPKKRIVTNPTPFNAGQVVYKDKGNNCYVFRATEVSCDDEKTKYKTQKLQSV